MKTILRHTGLVLAATAMVLVPLVQRAQATGTENETFGVSPFPEQVNGAERRTFAIPLEAGASFEDAIRVYNRTDQSLDLAIYATDATASSGEPSVITVGIRGSTPTGVGSWIELTRTTVSLPPRGEAIVHFRINVETAQPKPDIGAIVVENNARGLSADLAKRLNVVVRTAPAGSPTTSKRVRPFLLRSPWVIVASLGAFACLVLVWLGWRRARRPQDTITSPGELADGEDELAPVGSRPRLHRLGREKTDTGPESTIPAHDRTESITTSRPARDRRPLLETDRDEHAYVEDDEDPPALSGLLLDDDDLEVFERRAARHVRTAEPAPARGPRRASPPVQKKKPKSDTKKLGYIPLDDL